MLTIIAKNGQIIAILDGQYVRFLQLCHWAYSDIFFVYNNSLPNRIMVVD
jgi:hypothetical protein